MKSGPASWHSIPGQLLTLLALVLAALAFLPLFDEPWEWQTTPSRMLWAIASTLAFAAAWALGAWRRRQRQRPASVPQGEEVIGVFHASQTGLAQALAGQLAQALEDGGHAVCLMSLAHLDADTLARLRRAVFVVSTTGEGDAPDEAAGFVQRLLGQGVPLPRLQFAVLALGDRHYAQFCAFGRRLEAWLVEQGAQPLFARIDVDNADAASLAAWQAALGECFDVHLQSTALQQAGPWQPWRLVQRQWLNPGSQGEAIFHLELQPEDGALPNWQAGDLAEIRPRHRPDTVQAWLAACGIEGACRVETASGTQRLDDYLSGCQWPDAAAVRGQSAQAIADAVQELHGREYSIASLPRDGHLALLVRQARKADGNLGLGSGWLTAHLEMHQSVQLRLRPNPRFHAPLQDIPLILVGNGSGMAGLRALLRERIAQGRQRNWLLFGERQRAHDFHYRQELEAALAAGDLLRMDLAFSRDADSGHYVQHLIGQQAERLREWVQLGAAIHVCGSREGMAAGVDAALREALGDAGVDALVAAGRYRRDVY